MKKNMSKTMPLPESFIKKNMIYSLVWKRPGLYLYKVTGQDSDSCYYELFKEKIIKSGNIKGQDGIDREYRSRVQYPGDEDFGKWAWCCNDLESVDKIMKLQKL